MSGRISFVGVLCVAAAGVVGPAFRRRSVGLFAVGDPWRPTARAFSGWGREQHSVWERQMTLIASFSFKPRPSSCPYWFQSTRCSSLSPPTAPWKAPRFSVCKRGGEIGL